MNKYSTREAANKLGISVTSMNRYIADKKLPLPPVVKVGGVQVRLWSDSEIERVRVLLPKLANGRKTRYQKLTDKQKTQAGAPALQKSRKAKRKKKR